MTSADRTKFHEIKDLQKFNGAFTLDATLSKCLGLDLQKLQQAASAGGWNTNAYATAVALAYFIIKLPSLQADWELIADKSKIWLLNNYREQYESMYESAAKFF